MPDPFTAIRWLWAYLGIAPQEKLDTSLFLVRLTFTHAMKSRKNLTRFTYENSAFLGWRLCLAYKGTPFLRYFPDKKYGSERKALKAASDTLEKLKALLDGSRLMKGKLSKTTIEKAKKMLKDA